MESHPQNHTYYIRYKPNTPHHNTKPIEFPLRLRRTFHIRPYRPRSMHEHQKNRNQPRHRVKLIMQMRHRSNAFHQRRPHRIGNQPQKKENKVPKLQSFLQSFPPHANRIKHKCGRNDKDCRQQIMHIYLIQFHNIQVFINNKPMNG